MPPKIGIAPTKKRGFSDPVVADWQQVLSPLVLRAGQSGGHLTNLLRRDRASSAAHRAQWNVLVPSAIARCLSCSC